MNTLENKPAPALEGPKTLEQRVRTRVQESINSVLEDDELSKLVDEEIVKLLKGYTIPARNAYSAATEVPPQLPIWVKQEAEAQMKQRIAVRLGELLSSPEFQITRDFNPDGSNTINFGPELEKAFRAVAPMLVQQMFGGVVDYCMMQMRNSLASMANKQY